MTEATIQKTAMFSRNHVNKGEKDKALEDEIKSLEEGQTTADQEDLTDEEVKPKDVEDEGLSAEDKAFKKRYSDLRRHSQQKENEFKNRIEELERKISKAPATAVMPKTEAEVEAWVKQYPDIAGIVLGLVKGNSADRSSELDERMKRIEQAEMEAIAKRSEEKLKELHPDIDDLRNSDAFHEWADEQPRWVQVALYEEDDPRAAARAIDLYKADKGIKATKPKTPERSAAEGVRTPERAAPRDDGLNGQVFKESDVSKMSPREYERKEKAIFEAIQNKRFVYDVSGAAR